MGFGVRQCLCHEAPTGNIDRAAFEGAFQDANRRDPFAAFDQIGGDIAERSAGDVFVRTGRAIGSTVWAWLQFHGGAEEIAVGKHFGQDTDTMAEQSIGPRIEREVG